MAINRSQLKRWCKQRCMFANKIEVPRGHALLKLRRSRKVRMRCLKKFHCHRNNFFGPILLVHLFPEWHMHLRISYPPPVSPRDMQVNPGWLINIHTVLHFEASRKTRKHCVLCKTHVKSVSIIELILKYQNRPHWISFSFCKSLFLIDYLATQLKIYFRYFVIKLAILRNFMVKFSKIGQVYLRSL